MLAVVNDMFSFPNPVNETSARLVAGGAVVQGVLYLAIREWVLLLPLAYGFVARVLTGPTLSPLGQLVTRVVTPRLTGPHRFVAGPPKRFAQGMGVMFSLGALAATALGQPALAVALIAALVVAASLEAVFAFCLGCLVFNRLMRWGLIPRSVCEDCADISGRLSAALNRELVASP
jgi:hypothetical protein